MKIFKTNFKFLKGICVFFLGSVLTVVSIAPAAIAAGPAAVNLGTAANFAALAKTAISTTGTTAIVGDIGVSPAAGSYITGFDLILDSSTTYSTSSLVTGKIYAADYTPPTPTYMTTAVSDMETAYTDAAGRPIPDYTELYSGDVTGQTLTPGLYKWGTGVLISAGGVTISGTESDVWIFQIAQDLTVANGAIVTLSDGAQAKNVFWQVAGQTTIGSTVQFKGNILGQTAIVMNSGASLDGRALAQTAVTLNANTITKPSEATVEIGLATNGFSLSQNFPNPFNASTTIQYSINKTAMVSLKVYNVVGYEIDTLVNSRQEAGRYALTYNASNLSSGVYFYRLESGASVSIKKLVFVK